MSGTEFDGYRVYKNFFSPQDLAEIKSLATARIKTNDKKTLNPYSSFVSVSEYDVLVKADADKNQKLTSVNAEIEKLMHNKMNLYNSIWFEIHGKEINEKPGFGWHQDVFSFNILEEKTKATIAWFILENDFPGGDGTLEFISFENIKKMTGLDLRGKGIYFFDTQEFKKKYGSDLTKHGKYVVVEAWTFNVLGFFDEPLDKYAEKPELKTGDLVIFDRYIIHRSGTTKADRGHRIAITVRYVEPGAKYNGCFDKGILIHHYGVYSNSLLLQRLVKQGRGAPIYG